jgi:hypothetical protein
MAFDRYAYEGDQMMNEYGMLLDRENTDYNRYLQNLDAYYKELDYRTDRYDTERGIDLDQYAQGRAEAWDEYAAGREEAWDDYVRGIENEETAAGLLAGVGEFDRLKDMYGLTDDEVAKLEASHTTEKEPSKEEDKKVNWDNGKLTASQVKKLQQILGVDVDGKWGDKSSSAAGGMTAEEAWKAYQNGTLKPQKQEGDTSGFTGKTYDEAVAYMKSMGVPNANASTIMTASEWTRRKNAGSSNAAVQNYSSYEEYLADYVAYAIETYG